MNKSFYLPIFEALGHETRFTVFEFIYHSGKTGVRPKEMSDKFGFDSGTLSFHLKKLMAVKLITLKAGDRRGVYCAREDIPPELIRLFESKDASNTLLMRIPELVTASKLEVFH